jgi:hypothetical protein
LETVALSASLRAVTQWVVERQARMGLLEHFRELAQFLVYLVTGKHRR